jgi:hypothetical protein
LRPSSPALGAPPPSTGLVRHSITLLRISMGAVIFTFGLVKYAPGLSPAEDLVLATTHLLTFGLVPDNVALVLIATVECCIGLSLLTARLMHITVYLQAMWLIGSLSPVVLLPERLFSGPSPRSWLSPPRSGAMRKTQRSAHRQAKCDA